MIEENAFLKQWWSFWVRMCLSTVHYGGHVTHPHTHLTDRKREILYMKWVTNLLPLPFNVNVLRCWIDMTDCIYWVSMLTVILISEIHMDFSKRSDLYHFCLTGLDNIFKEKLFIIYVIMTKCIKVSLKCWGLYYIFILYIKPVYIWLIIYCMHCLYHTSCWNK